MIALETQASLFRNNICVISSGLFFFFFFSPIHLQLINPKSKLNKLPKLMEI